MESANDFCTTVVNRLPRQLVNGQPIWPRGTWGAAVALLPGPRQRGHCSGRPERQRARGAPPAAHGARLPAADGLPGPGIPVAGVLLPRDCPFGLEAKLEILLNLQAVAHQGHLYNSTYRYTGTKFLSHNISLHFEILIGVPFRWLTCSQRIRTDLVYGVAMLLKLNKS